MRTFLLVMSLPLLALVVPQIFSHADDTKLKNNHLRADITSVDVPRISATMRKNFISIPVLGWGQCPGPARTTSLNIHLYFATPE